MNYITEWAATLSRLAPVVLTGVFVDVFKKVENFIRFKASLDT